MCNLKLTLIFILDEVLPYPFFLYDSSILFALLLLLLLLLYYYHHHHHHHHPKYDLPLYFSTLWSIFTLQFAFPVDTAENSGISTDADSEAGTPVKTASLLDLYSGCGGMSTGLCLGSALAGLKLETVISLPYILLKTMFWHFSALTVLFLLCRNGLLTWTALHARALNITIPKQRCGFWIASLDSICSVHLV